MLESTLTHHTSSITYHASGIRGQGPLTISSIESQHTLSLSVGAFVDELTRSGVRHFCVCPGSRSTPLALTIARHPAAKLCGHIDERSAAFFGLALAKPLREPVALVCTSGTATANFMPAVVEA